ncbi:MAG: (d)CMP kinase [Anaerolineaceae bacterium]|nr:(d)CMP kinase [Anaerolineaceae bacterium]
MKKPKIITIDGPAASGKSTIAEKLSIHFEFLYFDTGVMYRAVTWAALQDLGGVDNEASVSALAKRIQIDVRSPTINDGRKYEVLVNGEDITQKIRLPEVNQNVSQVSTYRGVREAMSAQQRKIGLREAVVMVGRDIGTVVLPEADMKIYLDASAEERARRRYVEEKSNPSSQSYEEILASILRRDEIDSNRDVAPLKPASDAVIIISDDLDIEGVFQKVLEIIQSRMG